MMSRSPALCVAAAGLVLLAGCFSLKREPPQKNRFGLDVPPSEELCFTQDGLALYIRPVRVAHLYDGKGFVYRRADGTYETDFYNEFAAPPDELFTEALRSWFSAPGLTLRVVDGIDKHLASLILDVRVNALFADFSEKKSPRSVLAGSNA